jgi:uncharacterized membrane protein YfcA
MNLLSLLILFAASFGAGIVNTIAGGGSFLTFSALVFSGLDPRAANITSTIALFPMQIGTGYAGRANAGGTETLSFRAFLLISLLGGVVGAFLLLLTPSAVFAHLVPWLILFATAIFAYGSFFKKPGDLAAGYHLGRICSVLTQFCISIYGGYFGGGIGFLMLAALTLAGMTIRKAGATKNILAAFMNAAAVFIFLFSHDIGWQQVGITAVASMLGGFVGVKVLHQVNERILRIIVIVIGLALTVAMFAY